MTAPDASETLLHAIDTLAPVIRHHADAARRHRRLALPIGRGLVLRWRIGLTSQMEIRYYMHPPRNLSGQASSKIS